MTELRRAFEVDKLISIIVRTKNEERWISQCLSAIFSQRYKNFEVILVDNVSTDKTIEKAREFKLKKVITCEDYIPGKVLNMGIRASSGSYIVSISGHCIPVNDRWLESLLKNFEDVLVAGVYGRQEAMSFTPDADKRDLALVFGMDRRTQVKDSFFHNANSMIRRQIWQEIPFDETVTNIEDRVWAKKALEKGYKIIYEPQASAFHYHGIHQNGDRERCRNVVRVLENLHSDYQYKSIDLEKLNVVALIPVRGPIQYLNRKPILSYTVKRAIESRYIKRTIVSTDDKILAELAKALGAEAPFIRDPAFSQNGVDLGKVLQYTLERIEALKIFPDIVVSLEVTFPFRPKGLLDNMIMQLAKLGLDSVIVARRENRSIWKEKDNEIIQIDEGMTPRKLKDPCFIGLRGVGCVTHPEFLRSGNLLGKRIGIYEVNDPYSHLEVRDEEDFKLASLLIDKWFK